MKLNKYQINQKRSRDLFYKTRKRAIKEYSKLTNKKELIKNYDIRNHLMVEYELV